MAISSLSLLILVSLLLGHVFVQLEASHRVYHNLQIDQSSISIPTHQPYRTAYHFQPPKNWINDPNGPMIYKGIYHLFYQYNPKGAVWGNILWAHSVSKDLVNWEPLNPAIYPSQPSDINGCWSGSATILPDGKPAILYTGIDTQNRQVQNLAFPKNASDPYLKEWVKSPKNPLMAPTSANRINASSFRDPTTAWLGHDGHWRVIIGSKRGHRGLAILYRSKDFVHWFEAKHPLNSAKKTGMWECPDFYPVLINSPIGVDTSINGPFVRHVLKVSLDDTKHDHYMIGTYDTVKDRFNPLYRGFENGNKSVLRYDYGKFYASKTFFDESTHRRILFGWINESSSVKDDIKKGWSGIQAIPRTVWLHKSGKQLVQWPIVEIDKLRTGPVMWPRKLLKGGSLLQVSGLMAAQADIEVSFTVTEFEKAEVLEPSWTDPQLMCSRKGASVKGRLGPFGLLTLASKSLQEYTAVFFRIFRNNDNYVVLLCSDQSRSSLNGDNDKTTYGTFVNINPIHEKLSLRSLIDHSIVESFAGEGKACITARVYPILAINNEAHLHVFNNGSANVSITRLKAWSMQKAHIN